MRRLLFSAAPIIALVVCLGAVRPGFSAFPANHPAPGLLANPPQSRYTVTDLGSGEAFAVSNNGKVAGTSGSGSSAQAFLWEDGVVTSLGTLGGSWSTAYGVNDAGQVVGISLTGSGYSGAFLWQNGSMQNLGSLGGNGPSGALAINNAGQVVGFSINNTPQMHAFLWDGGMTDLGALGDGASYAYAINNTGQVAGWAKVGTEPTISEHAFLWNGSMQDLGTGSWAQSSARGINDNGDVVGRLINEGSGTDWHAALSPGGGGMQDLGGSLSTAYDINNAGLIVGESGGSAVLWESGQMQDLNSLIPAGSGWVLQNARAINDKGEIVGKGTYNGQAHAFLLEPTGYRWINPAGGSWHVATNWDPVGIPGAGDTAIFDLSGNYSVAVSTLASLNRMFAIDRVVVSSTNVVQFNDMDLNMVYDSPEKPSLEIDDGATAHVYSGAATFSHAIIGGKAPGNPSNPPTAHLQVVGNGTSLTGSGRLTVGDEGRGDLFVTGGGHLTSAETRLGGLLSGAHGEAEVSGDGSYWRTGNIAVGYGDSASLVIRGGARVDSDDAFISYGALSEDSQVTIDGVGASQASLWALQGSLTIGQSWFADVEVLNGGNLYVGQDVHIKNGELNAEGILPSGDPSRFDVLGNVFVGGPDPCLLALRNGGSGYIDGNLVLGMDGPAAAILWGPASVTNWTKLEVLGSPPAGLCAIGRSFEAAISLNEGGMLLCRNLEVGGRPGMGGRGSLDVNGGMVRAVDILTVGFDGGGRGRVELENEGMVWADAGAYIATPGDTIQGTGYLVVGFPGLLNDGVLGPGISVSPPKAPAGASLSTRQARDGPATLSIEGALTMGYTGRLAIPVSGSDPGQYGSLAVSEVANLNGVLVLDFVDGFAPRQGDTYAFLTATGGVSGAFSSVEISGLSPDFEYELTTEGGRVTLTALNDGTPASSRRALDVALPRPNPFRATTDVPFTLASASRVRVTILDVAGSLVRTLVDGRLPAGAHVVTWDGRDGSQRVVGCGVYVCLVTGADERMARKVLVLR